MKMMHGSGIYVSKQRSLTPVVIFTLDSVSLFRGDPGSVGSPDFWPHFEMSLDKTMTPEPLVLYLFIYLFIVMLS